MTEILEYLGQNLWQVWTLVAVLCLVLELTSGDFVLVCFSVGAALAAAVCPFAGFYLQLAVFVVATIFALVLLRPFCKRYFHTDGGGRVSNADAVVGRVCKVVETIKVGGHGRVSIDGDVWKAYSDTETDINVGDNVKVIDRKSTILTVERA